MIETPRHRIRLVSGSASLVGRVRAGNEDSYLVTPDVLVVADGMGGHLAGEVASAQAVEVVAEVAGNRSLVDLVAAVHMANRAISDRAADSDQLRGMGTTICLVGLVAEDGEHLAILNVGDSRIYLMADGGLHQLTEDHSLVESLVREGRITEAEAEVHPQRNVLTRALGVEPLVVVDAWLLQPCDGDRLLLCSDGLFNELSNERILEVLADGDEPEIAARRLAAEAEAAGGRDNITTVVADVVDSGRPPAPHLDRYRRIATPTVDLDDHFRESSSDTATVPLVSISPVPPRGDDDDDGSVDQEGDGAGDDQPGDHENDPYVGSDGGDPIGEAIGDDTEWVDGERSDNDSDDLREDGGGGDVARESAEGRTWRSVAFVLALVMIVAVVVGALFVVARGGWYVGADDGEVIMYRGMFRSLPLLGSREVERFPDIRLDELREKERADIEDGKTFDSRSEADGYVQFLENSMDTSTTTTTTSTTSTTVPTTTTAAPTTTAGSVPGAAATLPKPGQTPGPGT